LAAELDATFAELERSGKTAAELGQFIGELSESNAADLDLAPLLDKTARRPAASTTRYTIYLGQERLDQHRRLMQVEASLSTCSFLKTATIYVDGFADFTHYERRILVGAAKAGARIEIALLIDPASVVVADPHAQPFELSLFRRTEDAYRRLYFRLHRGWRPGFGPDSARSGFAIASRSLHALERRLFHDPVIPQAGGDGIELIEAPDRTCEVDTLARGIRGLLMQGLRLREIGVTGAGPGDVPGADPVGFRGAWDSIFPGSKACGGAINPLLEFVRSLFRLPGTLGRTMR